MIMVKLISFRGDLTSKECLEITDKLDELKKLTNVVDILMHTVRRFRCDGGFDHGHAMSFIMELTDEEYRRLVDASHDGTIKMGGYLFYFTFPTAIGGRKYER